MISGYDVVSGDITNDRMYVVLDRFFDGEITDTALVNSLSALKLGKQYVAKTEKACKNIVILDEKAVSAKEQNALRYKAETNRLEGVRLADEICKKHRREGRFFDEILEVSAL